VGVWFRGDPAGASAEEARRNTHGKRSAWSGNQQANLTEPIDKKSSKILYLIIGEFLSFFILSSSYIYIFSLKR
jgi:hypothetical protein